MYGAKDEAIGMRLSLVTWSLGPGGAERVLSSLANEWTRDHEVTFITLSGDFPDHFQPTDRERRIRLRMELADSFLKTIKTNALMARDLRRALESIDAEVVVSFMDRTNNQVLLATRGLNIPVVVSERVDPRFHQIPRKARLLRRVLYPRADAVVVQTESVRRWCERFIKPANVWVIPNPVQPCPHPETERQRMVVAVGRLVPEKGFDVLLEAFASATRSFPDWTLTILGEGPERSALQFLARSYGIEGRVSFPGVVDDPSKYLARAGLFVLSSRYEGFPNALLEAMACGTPSIATDCPSGPSEIVRDGVDGLLVAVEDPDGLAGEMRRLMGNPMLRHELGQQAKGVTERFALDQVLDHWSAVFRTVVGRE